MSRRRFVSRRPVRKWKFQYHVSDCGPSVSSVDEDYDLQVDHQSKADQDIPIELHLPAASSTPRRGHTELSMCSSLRDVTASWGDDHVLSGAGAASHSPSAVKRHSVAMADGTSLPAHSGTEKSLPLHASARKDISSRQHCDVSSSKAQTPSVVSVGHVSQAASPSRGLTQPDNLQFSCQLQAQPLTEQPRKRKHASLTSAQLRKKKAVRPERKEIDDGDSVLSLQDGRRSVQLLSWDDQQRKASSLSDLDVVLTSLRHICRYQRQVTHNAVCEESVSTFYSKCKEHLLSLMEAADSSRRTTLAIRSAKIKTTKARKQLLQLQKQKLALQTELDRIKQSQLEKRQYLQKLHQVDQFITTITDLVAAFSQ